MSNSNPTKAPAALVAIQMFVRGTQNLLAQSAPMVIAGLAYPFDQLTKKLSDVEAPYLAVQTAQQQLKDAEDALKVAQPAIEAFVAAFKAAVKGCFSPTNPKLAQFGIKPAVPPAPLTTEQKVMRNARAAATRKARGTLGPKQKAAIKVTDVPAQVVDDSGTHPVSTATTPASSTAPDTGTAAAVASSK